MDTRPFNPGKQFIGEVHNYSGEKLIILAKFTIMLANWKFEAFISSCEPQLASGIHQTS